MGLIPESVIDEILLKADIESVVGRYVSLSRKGGNLWGLCPFHHEKTASFSVNPSKGIYKCFGCNKGGNAINFIMEIEHLNYPEAIRYLGGIYGIEVPDTRDGSNSDSAREKTKRVKALLTEAAKFYYLQFNDPETGVPAQAYAKKRALDKETLNHFGIGYSPASWEATREYLEGKGYTEEEMLDSGIFKKSEKTGKLFDLFRGRLMFPIFDSFGNIIAFGGRSLGNEMPKYINSPDSLVYNKQNHLYALNFAKKEQSKQLIVVEGYMDAIAMHKAGFRNTVAALGTSFTDSQLKLCARYCEEVVFFFDADGAGQKAAIRAIKMMLAYLAKLTGINIRIKIAKVPNGKDPDEFIRENGAEKFAEVVKNALYVEDYLLDRAYHDNYDDVKGIDKGRYQDDACLYGSWIPDEIKRSTMANEAAKVLGANPAAVLNRMNSLADSVDARENLMQAREIARQKAEDLKSRNIASEEPSGEPSSEPDAPQASEPENVYAVVDSATDDEIKLFAYAISLGPSLADQKFVALEDVLRPDDFTGDSMKALVKSFLSVFDAMKGVSFARMSDFFRRATINGMPSEDVMLKECDKADSASNVNVKRDYYLGYLYKIRIVRVKELEESLITQRMYAPTVEEKNEIDGKLSRLSEYKNKMREKLEDL
ncbi:MAG: DNA primase [Saccharofermentans sp.]|nr:DNA primase [Saccharofermentans sp.]